MRFQNGAPSGYIRLSPLGRRGRCRSCRNNRLESECLGRSGERKGLAERRGEMLDVAVDGPITLDSQEIMVEAAVRGCGLAYVWKGRATRFIEAGALVPCLLDACPEIDNLFTYYPSRRRMSAGLRALIDILKR